jgi:putative hydrolase of the HAD superfamily
MIDTIIFDIGNVLTDFRWKDYIDSFGFSEEISERIGNGAVRSQAWKHFDLGVPEDIVLQELIDDDPDLEKEIREAFRDIGETVKMFSTTIPWLEELKDQGFRRLILSNLSSKTLRECAKDLEFLNHVDGGILSYRVGIIKPDRRIYDLLIKRYSLDPGRCVFLDDREENISMAESLGIHGIVFRDRTSALAELEKLGVPGSKV